MLINLGEKHLTTPDCIHNIKLQTTFPEKVEDIELNGSGWRYLKKQSMDVTFSKIDFIGSTSFFDLPPKHRSIINKKDTDEVHCAVLWSIVCLCLAKTNVSLTGGYVKHFNDINIKVLNYIQSCLQDYLMHCDHSFATMQLFLVVNFHRNFFSKNQYSIQ